MSVINALTPWSSKATLMQIGDERGEAAIEQWQVFAELFEVVTVIVPATEGECHHTGTGFNKATRGEEVLGQARSAVIAVAVLAFAITFDDAWVLAAQVKSVNQLWTREHVQGLLIEDIDTAHETGGIEVAAQSVEAGEQGLAIAQAVERDTIE
jgi:hypothetical protein